MKTTATINGIPLASDLPVSWSLVPGASPVQQIMAFAVSDGERILALAAATIPEEHDFKLKLKAPNATVEVKKLICLGQTPSDDPYHIFVIFTDIRWLWTRKIIRGRFNIRRKSGSTKRLEQEGDRPIQIEQVVPDIEYQPESINKATGDRWFSSSLLKEILNRLKGSIAQFAPGPSVPVENFELDDIGTSSMNRVLSLYSNTALFIDYEGKVNVINRLSGKELALVNAAGPEAVGGGHVNFISFGISAPRDVTVYLTRQHEVRFDFQEVGATDTSVPFDKEDRYMENVLPCPDPTLAIPPIAGADGQTRVARTVVKGTWITFDEAIAGWNGLANKNETHALTDISKAFIQEHWITGGLQLFYGEFASVDPDQDWMGRINAIRTHYRQTFRINRRWLDRLLSLTAERISLLDPESGTRAPADAFAGHAMVPTEQGLLSSARNADIAVNVISFTQFIVFPIQGDLKGARIAPVIVAADSEQGIIRFNFQTDLVGHFREILPSLLGDFVPKFARNNQRLDLISTDQELSSVNATGAPTKISITLSRTHRASVVLTCVPGYPNNKTQLHKVVFDNQKLKDLGLQPGNGPTLEIRVLPGVEPARFAWVDEASDVIERVFDLEGREVPGADEPIEQGPEQVNEDEVVLDDLLLNKEAVEAIAEQEVKTRMQEFRSRVQGSKTVYLNEIPIVGSLSALTHTVGPEGDATTKIEIEPTIEKADLFAGLPDGVRNVILQLVDTKK